MSSPTLKVWIIRDRLEVLGLVEADNYSLALRSARRKWRALFMGRRLRPWLNALQYIGAPRELRREAERAEHGLFARGVLPEG